MGGRPRAARQGLTTGRGSSGSSGETSPRWPEPGSAAQSSPPAGKARATRGWSGDTSSAVANKDNRTASAGVGEGLLRAVAGSSSQEPALPVWRPAHFTRVWEPHVHAVCAYGAWTRPLVCQRCRSLYLTDGSTYSSEGPWESRDSGTSAGSGRKSAGLSEGTGAQPPSALYSRVCSVP